MTALLSRRAARPRVLDEVAGRVHFERGSVEEFGTPHRVAVVAQWSRSATLTRSVTTLVNELADAGYRPVLVSACEQSVPLEWRGRMPAEVTILRRPNTGYDFGSWAVALNSVPAIAAADRVILTNDSMAGPFASIRDILRRCDDARADVTGLTDSRQYFRHLQSYFLCFTGGILADAPLAGFFDGVRVEHDKWDIIRRYELGLNKLLRRESYGITPLYRADDVVAQPGDNPVIKAWWRLLERGFPFVKREIIRDPSLAPRGEWIAREVRTVYGQNIEDWI